MGERHVENSGPKRSSSHPSGAHKVEKTKEGKTETGISKLKEPFMLGVMSFRVLILCHYTTIIMISCVDSVSHVTILCMEQKILPVISCANSLSRVYSVIILCRTKLKKKQQSVRELNLFI